MSEVGGTPAAAPASAPSSPSASSGAPSGAGTSTPNQVSSAQTGSQGMQQTPETSQQASQPTRAPVLIKHRAQIGDQEHEIELDIAEHLAEHLAAQRFKFKADGADHDLSWEEVQQRLPMSQAAWKRMSQAAEATKKAEATVKEAQDWRARVEGTLRNPKTAMPLLEKALGGREQTLRVLEAYVADHLAEQKLTPQQRQQREVESTRQRELDARDRALAEREARIRADDERNAKAEEDQLVQRFTQEWPKALQGEGLPQTKQTMRMMARILSEAHAGGYQMTAAEAAREVKAEVQALLGGLDGGALRSAAPNAAEQLERARIEELNAVQPGRVAQRSQQQAARAKPNEPKAGETWEEMQDRIFRQRDSEYHESLLRRRG